MYADHKENKLRLSQVVVEALGWLEASRTVRTPSEACLSLLESLWLDPYRGGSRGGTSPLLLPGFCLVFHQMLPGVSTKLVKLLGDGQVWLIPYVHAIRSRTSNLCSPQKGPPEKQASGSTLLDNVRLHGHERRQ